MRAAAEFAAWRDANALNELRDIEPVHIAAYVEGLQQRLAPPFVKLHLAGIRMLFDVAECGGAYWLIDKIALAQCGHAALKAELPNHSRSGRSPSPITPHDTSAMTAMVATFS